MVLIKGEYGAPVRRGAYTAAALQLAKYAGKRVASYMQSRKGSSRSKQQSKVTSPGPITTQYDVALRYRRKPMPRRRRRIWKRFTNRVKHVMLQMNALSTYTIDFAENWTFAVNRQTTFGYMLGGTTGNANDELFQSFRQAYSSLITTTTVDDYKLFIKSLCMDVQLTNTGSAGAIVDCYTLIARSSDNVQETLSDQYDRLYTEMSSGAVSVPDVDSPASTPFQNGPFLQKWKILSKKEVLLGAGSVTTMQLRNAANRTMNGKAIESNPAYIPGYTRAFLFQVRGVPENAAGTARLAAGTITVARQWTVTYGIPPGSSRITAADS